MTKKGIEQSALREFVGSVRDLASKKDPDKRYLTGTVTHTDLDGTVWVNVSGGVSAMPVSRSTASYSPGDLVSFSIENGVASMGGNVTDPAVGGDQVIHVTKHVDNVEENVQIVQNVIADKASIGDLQAVNAEIDNLKAKDAEFDSAIAKKLEADDLQAVNADIDTLKSTKADIAALNAETARVDNLLAGYTKTDQLEATYAKIDLANVTNAWMENGVIKDAAISDAQIIGVSANKMTTGTLDASKVDVTNLNAKNINVEKINGVKVTGKSVADALAAAEGEIDGLSEDISDLDSKYAGYVADLNARVDAQIETWTAKAVPTLNNYPASSWNTAKLRDEHVGDICYVVNAGNEADGYTYRFAYDDTSSSYGWVLIKDNQVTKALQDLLTAQGDISNLQDFQSETSHWIDETDEGITEVRMQHNELKTVVDKTVKASTQLWHTKNGTALPTAPKAKVTDTSTAGNAWRAVVPAYSASYPNYFYCWQYEYADGTFGWSAVVRDVAMEESQQQGRKGVSDAAAADKKAGDAATAASNAQTTANTAKSTAEGNIKSSVMLWYTSNSTTPPVKPYADDSASYVSSTSTGAGAWTTVVPTYASGTPNYHYCYQQQRGDGKYQWTAPVYDQATSEAMKKAQAALPAATFETFESTTFKKVVDEVNESSTTITNLTESVRYGGRNLLKGSASISEAAGTCGWCANGYGDPDTVEHDGYECIHLQASATSKSVPSIRTRNRIPLDWDEMYTVSAYLMFDKEWMVNLSIPLHYHASSVANTDVFNLAVLGGGGGVVVSLQSPDNATVVPPNTWQRVIAQVKTNKTAPDSTKPYPTFAPFIYGGVRTVSETATVNLWMREYKFERGPFATPWEYAAEDVTSMSNTVNEVKQTATENKASIESLSKTVTANETDIEKKYSTLSQTLDGLSSTVGATIEESVTGPNLLTGNALNPNSWTISAPAGAGYAKAAYGTAGTKVSFATVSGYENLYSPAIAVTSGHTYTLTVEYTVGKEYTISNVAKPGYGLGVYRGTAFPGSSYDGSLASFLGKALFIQSATSKAWTATCTFTATSDSIVLMLNGGMIADSQTGLSFTLDKLKLVENVSSRLSTAETAIEQTANNVLIKATKSDTTAAQGAKSLIQSLINVAPEGVQISADKVDIEGAAIFTGSGKLAKVVTATQAEWYSSTSATSKAGGSWGTSQPSVVAGRFIWERQKVTYSNGTSEYKPSAEGVCTQGQSLAERRCLVGQSGSTNTNPWYKFASISITGAYQDRYIVFDVTCTYAFHGTGQLRASVRLGTGGATLDVKKLEWVSRNSYIQPAKFVMAYKANAAGNGFDIDLWAKIDSAYQFYRFDVVQEGNRNTLNSAPLWTLYDKSSAGSEAGIPDGYTQVVSTDADAAQITANAAAPKTSAIAREQRIWYRQTAIGAAPGKNQTWLSTSGTGYGNWSLTVPPLTSGSTKYPKLYTAVQSQTVAQQAAGSACTCTQPLLDDSTTVIDGGNIITGSVAANRIDAASGTFAVANIPDLSAAKITSGYISADRIQAGSLTLGHMDGLEDALSSLDDELDTKAETADVDGLTGDLKQLGDNMDARFKVIGEDIERAGRANQYVHFEEDVGLMLGESGSDVTHVLTNSRDSFRYKGEEVAAVGVDDDGTGALVIANASVSDKIGFGKFAWVVRNGGQNVSFKWNGE